MRTIKKLLGFTLAASLVLTTAACGTSGSKAETKEEVSTDILSHKIGVAVYSNDDDEVRMFQDYYKNYLEDAFSVEFIYSSPISSMEDEKNFVDLAKEESCEGIISFITTDLSDIVSYCGDDFYYVMGSGSVDEEEFQEASKYKNFLGVMGPSLENEKEAGSSMIRTLGGDDGANKTYVLLSGGSAIGNVMHRIRLNAMLETLQTEYGFEYEMSVEEMDSCQENVLAGTSAAGGSVYLCPGYLSRDAESLGTLLAEIDPDVIASTNVITPVEEIVKNEKEQSGKVQLQTGAVDCFSENNRIAFEEGELNYIVGKCAAMSAPAFVAMYNAITGHEDLVKEDGKAFSLHQNFWNASNAEEYAVKSAAAANIIDNIYTTKDLMDCMAEYNTEASRDNFKTFIEKLDLVEFE